MSNQVTLLNIFLEEFLKESNLNNADIAFESFATNQIFKDYDISFEEIQLGLVGEKKDYGIDGIFIFANDELINSEEEFQASNKPVFDFHFLQYKNTDTISEDVINKFIVASEELFNLDKDFNTLQGVISETLKDKILLIHKLIKLTASKHPKININFYHVCKGDASNIYGPRHNNYSYMHKIETLKTKITETNLGNITFDFKIIDASTILGLTRKEPNYSLQLKLNENPIALEYKETDERGYIASVNVIEYFKFLVDSTDNSLRKYLFESNIRDYQNNTTVNSEIIQTLKNKNELDFWWLNNGITIIAENGTLTGKTLNLDNVQIVNGLQTSHSIYHTFVEGLPESDSRSILLKIIITNKKETTDVIIKSNNSHNPVPPALLRATDKVQRDIEDYLLSHDLYYDRRKNYYKNLKKPTKQIVSINYLSQCLTALVEKNPSKARSNPTILTKNEQDYNRLFPNTRPMEVYSNSIKLMKKIETYLKQSFTAEDEVDVAVATYYHFHIGRVLISYLSNQVRYNGDRFLKLLDLDQIDDLKINAAFKITKELVLNYSSHNQQHNLTYISKQIPFSEYINANLASLLTS